MGCAFPMVLWKLFLWALDIVEKIFTESPAQFCCPLGWADASPGEAPAASQGCGEDSPP